MCRTTYCRNVLGNDIDKAADTYNQNACNKALIKLLSQTWAIKTCFIKTPVSIQYHLPSYYFLRCYKKIRQ